jgi:hypothetical protein
MNAVPLAVTMVVALVALASIAAVVLLLRRSTRLTGLTVGVSAGAAIAIVVGALFVGGSLTQSPAAVADTRPSRASVDLVDPAVRIELPTLAFEE